MWLLKFHIAFSILCLITFWGFAEVYKEQIKKNGWLTDEKKKKKFRNLLFFFVPIMNVICVLLLFLMICVTKADFQEWADYVKRESEENE